MIIGYAVEGLTDKGFIKGLRDRWCPYAKLEEAGVKGSGGGAIRRQIKQICLELAHKNASVIVLLTDANNEDWQTVKAEKMNRVPPLYQHIAVCGVADHNIECWLRTDRYYLAQELGISPEELDVPDPKPIIERYIPREEREEHVSSIVSNAPLRNWINASRSFKAFYEDARDISQRLECTIPNERER